LLGSFRLYVRRPNALYEIEDAWPPTGGIMADETPPEANDGSDPANSEYERQQKQDDHTGSFGQQGAPSNVGSSIQRATPGRKPLFGS